MVDTQPTGPGTASELPPEQLGPWYVLHTRSRQEKVVVQDLQALGIGVYLPLLRTVRYHGGRKAVVEAPLFGSYVFMRGSVEDTYRADRTKRIAKIIPVVDQATLDQELRSIQLALDKKANMEVYSFLKKGVRVEVRSGPLKGVRGVVEDRRSNRLFLQVEMLNMSASLEIDGSLLDPIN